MKAPKKKRVKDYRSTYLLHLEYGLLISLILFIFAFKVHFNPERNVEFTDQSQETVQIEEIVQTKHDVAPPSLPKPVVPVEVPNDEVVAEEVLDFSTEIDLGQELEIPVPPMEDQGNSKNGMEEEKIFVIVERMPELIGGYGQLQSQIRYPEMARMAGIEGLVVVQFIIDEKGSVAKPTIVRGIGGGCDEEALRIVKKAKFTPGLQQGRPVKVHYTLPIRFTLKNIN